MRIPFTYVLALTAAAAQAGPRRIQVPSMMRESCLISTGYSHTCALRLHEEDVVCWGDNYFGELGIDETVMRPALSPNSTRALLPGPAACVCAGTSFTCALLANGSVTCWGSGVSGATGHGNADQTGHLPGSMEGLAMLSLGVGSPLAVAVVCGDKFACALTEAGGLRCWGYGVSGQLGVGTTTNIGDEQGEMEALADIAMPNGAWVVHVTAGYQHVCAVLNTSTAVCWGAGESGELGQDSTSDIANSNPPRPLVRLPAINVGGATGPVVSVAAGGTHACLVDASERLYCFGENNHGQLGQDCQIDFGNSTQYSTSRMRPVVLPDGAELAQVVGGSGYTCVLSTAGKVYCFGQGTWLGRDNISDVGTSPGSMAELRALPLGGRPVAIATSGLGVHTCALYVDPVRAVQCWGAGEFGQLGRGNTSSVGSGGSSDRLSATQPVPF